VRSSNAPRVALSRLPDQALAVVAVAARPGYGFVTQWENSDVSLVDVSVLVAVKAGLDIAGTTMLEAAGLD
jgi:hypothetical protein